MSQSGAWRGRGEVNCVNWCDRQESNLYCGLRRPVSYPLEDGRVWQIAADRYCSCLGLFMHAGKLTNLVRCNNAAFFCPDL